MTPIIGAFATFIRAERGDLGAWIKRKVWPLSDYSETSQVWRGFRNRIRELQEAEAEAFKPRVVKNTVEETFDHDLEQKA